MAELNQEKEIAAQLSVIEGKAILVRPSVQLRRRLEAEAKEQVRSLNNLVIVIIERYFRVKDARPNRIKLPENR